jgi:hypothetical protein
MLSIAYWFLGIPRGTVLRVVRRRGMSIGVRREQGEQQQQQA